MKNLISENLSKAIECYNNNEMLYIDNLAEFKSINELTKDTSFINIVKPNEIPLLINEILFGSEELSTSNYEKALNLFKMLHVNTPPNYRTRPLNRLKGIIKFTRGKKKRT